MKNGQKEERAKGQTMINKTLHRKLKIEQHDSLRKCMLIYIYLSCTGFIRPVKLHWLDNVLLYTVTDQHIAFLVPASCRATERNGNNRIADDVFESY